MGKLSLPLTLARRELRGGFKGFGIFLGCLFLGVAAIAAVGSMSQAITAGLAEDARAILGGDVSIRLSQRPANTQELNFFSQAGHVSEAVYLHTMARNNSGGRHSLVEIKAVDSRYPLYGNLVTEPPLDPAPLFRIRDGIAGIAVDANLLDRLDASIGDQLHLGEAIFTVRATVVKEPDRVGGTLGVNLGPRILMAAADLPKTGLVQMGSLINYHYRLRLGAEETVVAWRKKLSVAFPNAGWRVRDLSNAAPGLERLIRQLTLFMTLIGLTALLIGGVGISNAVRSYLDSKAGVIATLKCLGASTRLIFRTYLIQILILAGVGIALGVTVGALVPFASSTVLFDLLPVSAKPGLYLEPLALAAAFGLLTTLTFSIWPVAIACEIPAGGLFRSLVTPLRRWPKRGHMAFGSLAAVSLATLVVVTADERLFAIWFVLGALAALVGFWLTGHAITALARRVHGVRRTALRMAIANLHRPSAPTASVILSLGLGLTVLVAISMIEGNLQRLVQGSLLEESPSFFFIDIQPDQIEPFRELTANVDGTNRVDSVPILRGRISIVDGIPAHQVKVTPNAKWVLRGDRGITWSAMPPRHSKIVSGQWWPPNYAGKPLVSLDADIAQGLGVGVGDTLTVNVLGQNITGEITNLRQIDWSTLGINFVMVFSPSTFERAPQTHMATVYADPWAEANLEEAVLNRFVNVSAIRVKEALETVSTIIGDIGLAVRLVALVTLASSVLVLAGAIATGHRRRVYDSVVLKVLGATRPGIASVFLLEYGFLGLITASIASVFGSLAAVSVMTWIMEIDSVILPSVVAFTAIVCSALTIATGFAGTWRALGQKAGPILRHE